MKKLSFLLFLTLQMGMAQAQEKLVALSFDDGPNTTTCLTLYLIYLLKRWHLFHLVVLIYVSLSF